jgi:hypothetical protein
MRYRHHILRISRIPRRIAYWADLHVRLALLRLANRYGRLAITHPAGPVVSLTTYGTRAESVHLVIEAIGRGQMRPSRIVLWLDDVSLIHNLPIGIRRLQRRGLEVRQCENYGPYKKFYPYVESLQDFNVPLVTADDDVLYPRQWLKKLAEAFQQFPDVVNCHRAHTIALNGCGFENYESWELTGSTKPSFRHFATGVAGVIYPPLFQRVLKQRATAFLDCCPKNDDIWLHAQALRSGYRVRQIGERGFRIVEIPGTQSNGLYHHNVGRGGNDFHITTTYRPSDMDCLRGCEES